MKSLNRCLFTHIYWVPLQGRSCLPISPLFCFHLHANLVYSATATASRHPWVASPWFKICMQNYSWPKSKFKTSSPMVAGLEGQHFWTPPQQDIWSVVAAQWRADAATFAILRNKEGRAACVWRAPTLGQTCLLLAKNQVFTWDSLDREVAAKAQKWCWGTKDIIVAQWRADTTLTFDFNGFWIYLFSKASRI